MKLCNSVFHLSLQLADGKTHLYVQFANGKPTLTSISAWKVSTSAFSFQIADNGMLGMTVLCQNTKLYMHVSVKMLHNQYSFHNTIRYSHNL